MEEPVQVHGHQKSDFITASRTEVQQKAWPYSSSVIALTCVGTPGPYISDRQATRAFFDSLVSFKNFCVGLVGLAAPATPA
jgi:hypothetical protein